MKMRIEVYQRQGGNVHVVLQGQATDNSAAVDPEVFDRYVEVWRAFAHPQSPRLELGEDDPQGDSYSRAASAVSR